MANSSPENPIRRAEELSDKALEQSLSDAEHAELMQLLAQNPAVRNTFFDTVVLHALLREGVNKSENDSLSARLFGVRPDELAELTAKLTSDGWEGAAKCEPAPARPIESRTSTGRKWAGRPMLAAGMALLAFVFCYEAWLRPQVVGLHSEPSVSETQSTPHDNIGTSSVARLTHLNGCFWGGDSPQFTKIDSQVRSGDEITLHEGLAEFRLESGVSLAVEGPASLLLVSSSTLVLQYGKLTAYVPWGSTDFKVVSGNSRFTVRDAEFGISRKEGKLDVHVFAGEVTAASSVVAGAFDGEDDPPSGGDDSNCFQGAVVAAGRQLQLTTDGELLAVAGWDKANPALFVSKLSMSGPLPVTKEYVDLVMASQPIGYWRFERIANEKIPNEIKPGPPLKVKDNSTLVGDNGNRSAELHSDGDWFVRTVQRVPLAGSDYSLEAWVKPSHLHQGRIIGLQCKDPYRSGAFVELKGGVSDSHSEKKSGKLRYVHRAQKEAPDAPTACYSSDSYRGRRWQHIVAVKSGPRMELYLDGKRYEVIDESPPLPEDTFVVVGVHHGDRRTRKFIGQIDEVAVYNRALSEKEVAEHYEAMNQAVNQSQAKNTGKKTLSLDEKAIGRGRSLEPEDGVALLLANHWND